MRIAIGSAFRNSAGIQLNRYATQLDNLNKACATIGHTVRWIATEGDSKDGTRFEIETYARQIGVPLELVTRNHGGPVFGSTEDPRRMKALSYVGNGTLEAVKEDDDVLFYVESDLVWKADAILRLISQLRPDVDVIAPLIFAGKMFYDVWAYRGLDGNRFSPFFPYHSQLQHSQLTEISSAGSSLVMRAEVARRCRIIEDGALVGFCKDVRANGYRIFCDPTEKVVHL